MRITFPLYLLFAVSVSFSRLCAAVTVTQLTASVSFPAPVGTPVTWTAVVSDSNSGPLAYQFSVQWGAQPWSIVRDFSPLASFPYTVSQAEGNYQLRVIAKDFSSGEYGVLTMPFQITPLVTGSVPVATPTANPLVALFSAPACPAGSSMRGTFQLNGSSTINYTNWNACHPAATMNFYIAGMYAQSQYTLNYQIATGSIVTTGSNPISFTTGVPSVPFPPVSVLMPPTSGVDPSITLVLHGFVTFEPGFPVATDLAGQPLWYYDNVGVNTLLTRPVTGGTFLTIQDCPSLLSSTKQQCLREIDLAGNVVRETNAGIVSRQLAAKKTDTVGAFHHEAIRLPNGYTAVIGSTERLFPPGTQGSTTGNEVDILASMVVILDQNFQVFWSFDEFEHDGGAPQLDITRPATLGETCTAGNKYCPPLYLASVANDWTHCNSIYYISSTGDLLVSTRNQDWVYKVDYQNGSGTGNILWRLGLGGDFTMTSKLNYPWFSHQHDAKYQYGGTQILSLFDNGNLRQAQFPNATSRGQVLNVDETNMQVTLKLNVVLGIFSVGLGSAQRLPNGGYLFQPGLTNTQIPQNSYAIEVTSTGVPAYNIQGVGSYRAFGMSNLYAPPIE